MLVGANPTPALVSSLSLPGHRLVLVSSDATARFARRIADLVGRLRPGVETVETAGVGPDAHDFPAVEAALDTVALRLAPHPWLLDFTGGTKAMSVAAALCHDRAFPAADHPRAHRWRCYLDPVRTILRCADGTPLDRPAATGRIDVRTLAELHGAHWITDRDPLPVRTLRERGTQALRERFPGMRPDEYRGVHTEAGVLDFFHRHLSRLPQTEVVGQRRVADPYRAGGSIADFDAIVRHRHRVLCVEAKSGPAEVVARAGWTVAKARRVFGTETRVLFVYTGDPVPGLRDQVQAYNPALSPRHVHVWNLEELRRKLASPEALRREFFPGMAAPAPARGAGPAAAPGAGHRRAAPNAASPRTGAGPGRGPVSDLPPPRPAHPGPGDAPLLVAPLGGSRLGTIAALHAHRPAQALIVPSPQSIRDGVRDAAARALFAVEHPGRFAALTAAPGGEAALAHAVREAGYRDRVRFTPQPVDGADADAAAAAARQWIEHEQQAAQGAVPVVVDITTGTKPMSLGLALAARWTGACAAYQVPQRRAVVCLTHGEQPLHGRAEADWSLVLSGYRPLDGPLDAQATARARGQIDTDLLEAARRRLAAQVRGTVRVWADEALLPGADPLRVFTAHVRPSLVLTFGDRAVGLAAPAWEHRRAPDLPADPVRPGTWAQSVFAATVHLHTRCDVAGLVLALTRPGRDVTRARELVDWIAHADPGERAGAAGGAAGGKAGAGGADGGETGSGGVDLAFGDPLRPRVVVGEPGGGLPHLRAGALGRE